jgi:hypothetical protein
VRNLGYGDYEDVISGVDSMIARGLVETDPVARWAGAKAATPRRSSRVIATASRRVSVGADFNWMIYYVSTDIHPFTCQYL